MTHAGSHFNTFPGIAEKETLAFVRAAGNGRQRKACLGTNEHRKRQSPKAEGGESWRCCLRTWILLCLKTDPWEVQ